MSNEMKFADRIVMVSGAVSGIGKAAAQHQAWLGRGRIKPPGWACLIGGGAQLGLITQSYTLRKITMEKGPESIYSLGFGPARSGLPPSAR
jgi:hypothetical protein